MEYMKTIPDKWFDLAVVDPPYGISINMNMGRKKGEPKKHKSKEWDRFIPDKSYFDELFRVSKNQIIWGGNYFSLSPTGSWIFWDKEVSKGVSFSDGELAWTSFRHNLKKVYIPYSGFIGKDKERIHPTQKPVSLYAWIFQNYAKQGYRIFDSHLGSGSSRIAAYKLGFDFYATEIDKDYFDAQEERFRKECFGEIKLSNNTIIKQTQLFD